MILSRLIGRAKEALLTRNFWKEIDGVKGPGNEVLVVADVMSTYGFFNSETRTTAGTTIITTPDSNGSLVITDLIVSAERTNNVTLSVVLTDGTNSENLMLVTLTDAPANFGHSFRGRFQGWRDARLEMTLSGTAVATVTLGYTKVPTSLTFSEWDNLR